MAKISTANSEKIFRITKWLGLNESPDGDTKLKLGEASNMENFRITRDGNLQRRPGNTTTATVKQEGSGSVPVKGLWSGNVAGTDVIVAACDNTLWLVRDERGVVTEEIGPIDTTNRVFMFGYSERLYILNGSQYMVWDGFRYQNVAGYRPLVATAVTPAGAGTSLEQINKLNGRRRAWFSPDGSSTAFKVPETSVVAVDYVCNVGADDDLVLGTDYTVSIVSGVATVTFTTAPATAVSSIEVGWTVNVNYRSQVVAMRFAETFNGSTDNRVFLYGDGSNQAFYSGLDYDGQARADYFPDLNVLDVGEANTPITALIRHYSRLMAFKTNGTYMVQYGNISLDDDTVTPAFYTTAVNKTVGNVALGQAQLVLNAPYTLHGHDVFEWRNGTSYSSNLTMDERQARRISDRVTHTLDSFELADCICYDDNDHQEYYCVYNGTALIHNYAVDVWYKYTSFPATAFCNFGGELYYGTSSGTIEKLSTDYRSDNGDAISAYWESGSLTFDREYTRKYSAMLWLALKPESGSEITVTIQTDRKSSYAEKVVSRALQDFAHVHFGRYAFLTNRKPNIARLKIKAKKFVYYKLIFEAETEGTTATVLGADIKVRYTGDAK